MSNPRIGVFMTRLLTDEVLRMRFELNRMRVLGELQLQEGRLAASEIDLFLLSDIDMWSWMDRPIACRSH